MKSLRASAVELAQQQIVRYWRAKKRAVFFELGLNKGGQLRADALVLHTSQQIVVLEIKSCAQDFLTDKKWKSYLGYCHKFYFVVTSLKVAQLISERVGPGIGIVLVSETDYKVFKPARSRELGNDVILQIAIRAAYRAAPHTRAKAKTKVEAYSSKRGPR